MVFLKINWCKVKVQAQSANEIIQRNAFVIKKKKKLTCYGATTKSFIP
jgi:hypothetical protein